MWLENNLAKLLVVHTEVMWKFSWTKTTGNMSTACIYTTGSRPWWIAIASAVL